MIPNKSPAFLFLHSLPVSVLARWALTGGGVQDWVARKRLGCFLPAIEGHKTALLDFGKDSDRDFTALARGLSTVTDKFSRLKLQLGELEKVVRHQDENHACADAYRLFKRSVDLVHSSVGISLTEHERIGQVASRMKEAAAMRSRFERNNMLLHIVTINLRMEAARVDVESQSVFQNVALAVAETGANIEKSTTEAFGQIASVMASAELEQSHLATLEDTLGSRAQRSIDTIQRELVQLKQALEPCREENEGLVLLLAESSPVTLRILTALQHQDIVRQKLEHVAEGFEDMAQHLEFGHGGKDKSASLDEPYLHRAALLQREHLRAARVEIETAGTEVTESLSALINLGGRLLQQYERTRLRVDEAFGDSAVAKMLLREIDDLAQVANQGQETNRKISDLVVTISDVATHFTDALRNQEYEIRLVALNAQVASSHLPDAEALEKLAEEVNRIAAENALLIAELSQLLRDTLEHLKGIKTDADEFLRLVTGEREALLRDAKLVAERLELLTAAVNAEAAKLSGEFAEVQQLCSATLEGLRFPALIGGSFEPAERFCDTLEEATRESASKKLSREGSERLEAHQERYTMEHENRMHASVLAGGLAAAAVEASHAQPTESGKAGENDGFIELFDEAPAEPPTASTTPDSASEPSEATVSAAPKNAKEDFGDGIELF